MTTNSREPALESIVGMAASHVWLGHGKALYVELGALKQGTPRRDGSLGNPAGEVTLYAGYDWLIEGTGFTVNSRHDSIDHGVVGLLRGEAIVAVKAEGVGPQIDVAFSGGIRLRSASLADDEPDWTVTFADNVHVVPQSGRVVVDHGP